MTIQRDRYGLGWPSTPDRPRPNLVAAVRLAAAAAVAAAGLAILVDGGGTAAARHASTAVAIVCLTAAVAVAPVPRPAQFAAGVVTGLVLVGLAVRVLIDLGNPETRTSVTAVLGFGMLAVGASYVVASTASALHWQRRRHPPSLRRVAATSTTLEQLAGRLGLSPDEARGLLRRHRVPPAGGRGRR